MSARVYIEGGGDSKDMHIRCRKGFRRLLENSGFTGRMPHLVACGGRRAAFDGFATAHAHAAAGDYVALLVDSEEPVANINETWSHLTQRDRWNKPTGADEEQVLLMTTCMETWIASDRKALRDHYGAKLQENALLDLNDMEARKRGDVQNSLHRATRNCTNRYAKGKRSFEILERLDPAVLRRLLPSFARCERVLDEKL